MLGSEANREAAQRRARSYELLYLSVGRERSLVPQRYPLPAAGLRQAASPSVVGAPTFRGPCGQR
jgi:hypothetical protein